MSRVDLGLDVEADMTIARAAHERKHLGERRDTGPGYRELIGEPCRIRTPRADLADVVLLDLRERELDEGDAGVDVMSVGSAGEVGIQSPLMRDDDYAVPRDPHIELERVNAHRQG